MSVNLETLGGALKFIKRVRVEQGLRRALYQKDTVEEIFAYLHSEGLDFQESDMEGAYLHLLTNCQDKSEADELKEIVIWFSLLVQQTPSASR